MRKLFLLIALLLALASPATAQTTVKLWSFYDTGDIDANDESVTITNTQGAGTLSIQLAGTFTGTIAVECSVDGTTYQAIRLTPTNGTTGVTSMSATGIWSGSIAGCRRARARSTAWTSGTANVKLLGVSTGGGASSGGGGSGSNSAASATAAAVPADASYTGINIAGNLTGVTGKAAGSERAVSVAIVDSSGNQISTFGGSGGTSVNEDVASADAHPGTPAYAVRKATPANTSGTDGDYEALQMSAGRLWVSAVVDTALPTGSNVIGAVTQSGTWNIGTLATLTNALPAGNNNIGDVDIASFPDNEPINIAQMNGVAVTMGNGVSGTGVQRVTIASDSTGTVAVTQSTASSLNAQVVGTVAEDGAVSGNPVQVAGRASSAVPTAVSANGDVVRPWLSLFGASNTIVRDSAGDSAMDDTNNALRVNIVAGAGSGGTAMSDDAAYTVASTSFTPAGGTYRSTLDTVDDGDGGAFAMTQRRAIHTSWRKESDGSEMGIAASAPIFVRLSDGSSAVNPATDATHDSASSSTGPQQMLEAASDQSANTAVADGDAVRAIGDLLGRQITAGPCDRAARIGSVTTVTDGSSTSAIAASGAGIYNEIWDVIIANTSASAVTVDIRDGTAGSVMATLPVPANTAGVVHRFAVPLTGTANTAVAVDPSAAASSIIVTLRGCKAK